MRISVLGSWSESANDWGIRGSYDEFKQACYEVGRALGRLRQKVIVGGETERTADFHVVRGVVEELRGQQIPYPLIEVLRPTNKSAPVFESMARGHPSLFSFHIQSQAKWTELQLISLRESDVVLTIAGMKGTYQSGLAAIAAKKKLVPVASFGGASARLSATVEILVSPQERDQIRSLNGPWTSHSVDQVVRLAGLGSLPRVLIIHGHSADWQNLTEWLRTRTKISELIIMKNEFGAGKALPEKFEELASRVDRAIAVATPDDLGGLHGDAQSQYRSRARQNVWLEVGWFWGRLGRSNLMILSRGDLELPSDLSGLEFYEYRVDPTEQSEKVRAFLGLQ